MDLESKKLEIEILEKKLELARLQEKQKTETSKGNIETILPEMNQSTAIKKPLEPLRPVRRNYSAEAKEASKPIHLPKAEVIQAFVIAIIGIVLMVTFESWARTIGAIFCIFLSFIIAAAVHDFYQKTKSKTILFGGGFIALCIIGAIWGTYSKDSSTASSTSIITTQESKIKDQFNPWDGSHIALTSIIKSRLHDPSSFEQDETKYWTMSDHISVIQTYRAKNGFGAMRKQTAKAKFDFNGNLIGDVETL